MRCVILTYEMCYRSLQCFSISFATFGQCSRECWLSSHRRDVIAWRLTKFQFMLWNLNKWICLVNHPQQEPFKISYNFIIGINLHRTMKYLNLHLVAVWALNLSLNSHLIMLPEKSENLYTTAQLDLIISIF